MRRNRLLPFAVLAIASAAALGAPPQQTLAVRASAESFELSVPVSRLVMRIPRGSLVAVDDARHGGTASPRYFQLADPGGGIILSGRIESARADHGFGAFWKAETGAWTLNGLPPPGNLSILRLEQWEAAGYDTTVPRGSDTHLRAEWLQLGTWIDLHISVTSAELLAIARATALDVLKSIRVSEAP